MASKNKSNVIRIIRIYDAPLKLVWEVWTDPKHVAKWWGPRGFTLTTHSKDLKPGGHWNYTMHGPDGTDYPNRTVYHEVEKYSRLVYDHGATENTPPMFRVTALFSESNGKTKLDMSMALPTPEAAEEARKFIKKAGGDSTWDRLAEYLDKETSNLDTFVINRSFNSPIETVFQMWTDPKHVAKWIPPTGFEMQYLSVKIAPGGSSHYVMTGPNNLKMYGKAQYLEIEKPNRLVYTQQFCDEAGNLSRHPMAPVWPESMKTVVTFAVEDDSRTRVTVRWEPHGKTTAEEIEVFLKARGGMTMGWTGSFDKLEEFLDQNY